MADMLADIEPSDIGLGFKTFREIQREAIEQAVYSDKRFQGLCAPTGCGKSGIALGIHALTGWRTAVLTATKGLQDQYQKTPREFEITDIRGRSNYGCTEFEESRPDLKIDCADGPRMGCSLTKGNGCNYEECRNEAKRSQLVTPNYAYWFAINQRGPGGLELSEKDGDKRNPFECLILDEAHAAPEQLSNFLNVKVYEKEIRELMHLERPDAGESVEGWRQWATLNKVDVQSEFDARQADLLIHRRKAVRKDVDLVKRLEGLIEKLDILASMTGDDWICEYKEGTRFGRVWEFDAVWPGRYAERYLFRGIPKVVLLSATLRPKTMGLLGIKKEDSQFTEWPKMFPANRCPVYFLPPKKDGGKGKEIRIDRNTSEADLREWVEHIDRIIDGRTDRKGLICTVSYQRQQYLMGQSRHRQLMIGNTGEADSGTALDAYRHHVDSSRPTILVSPSFSTGWDFPGTGCEYIVICKIAFPDGRSKVMQARKKIDDGYANYLAALDLVQACGRGMRSEEDQCEVFLVDGHWSWFGPKNQHFMPMGFYNSVRRAVQIPKALPKLKVLTSS